MNYLSKENVQSIIGVSSIQKHIVEEDVESLKNVQQITYEINDSINKDTFQEAWDYVIKAYSPLRTIFRKLKNRTVQVILKERPIIIDNKDLMEVDEEERKNIIVEMTKKHYRSFKLSDGPLLRVGLFRISSDKTQVLLTYHKSILDMWSRDLVMSDVLLVYDSLRKAKTLPILQRSSFAEYTDWATQQDWNPAQEFWKKELTEFEEKRLITKDNTLNSDIDEYRTKTFLIPDRIMQSMNNFVRDYKIESRDIVLGTWSILLGLFGREKDIVFGYKSSGRNIELTNSENMIGQFANDYPLKINVDGNKNVLDYLKMIGFKCDEIDSYPYISASDIKNYCGISNPLTFETVVAIKDRNSLDNEHYKLQEMDVKQEINTDIFVEAIEDNNWTVRITYNPAVISQDMIMSMASSFNTVLESIVENPNSDIAELNLLSEGEKTRLNNEFNKTNIDKPKLDLLIQQVFENQVSRNPEAIAAMYLEEKITYRELNKRSNQLAHWLRENNFGRDDLALIFLERSIDMLICIIAVLKAGGGYVPVDKSYPDKRLQTILNSSKAKIIFTQKDLMIRNSKLIENVDFSPIVFAIDSNTDEVNMVNQYSTSNPKIINRPEDIANVFFTSGSTGKPKGAIIEHIGMLNHLWSKINLLNINNRSIVAQNASHCFDISVWQFLAPLMVGGCTVIYDNEIAKDPKELFINIQKDDVTILEMVPAMMEMFIQEIEEVEDGQRELAQLEYIISTGEGLPISLTNKWLRLYPDIKMINTYGATECSDDTNHLVISKPVESELSYIPLGKVIPNFKVYILDEYKRQVPMNCIGEVCLTGIGVGRGYLGDAERTKKAFVENPFKDSMGDRMYLTGDLGKFLPNGDLVFCGRKDFQVKVRGHRIELGEVESAILGHEKVAQCVAIIRPDASGQNRILSYVVLEEEIQEGILRQFIKTQLPNYMIPEHIIFIDKIPLSSNGKVNRKELPDPVTMKIRTETAKPSNPTEVALVDIWEEILQQSNIGIDDNFFEIGGHSLKTIQLRSRIKQYFKVNVTLKKLFEYQTIRSLASYILEMKNQNQDITVKSITKHEKVEYYPLTHAQKRLFFLQNLEPNSYSYNMPACFKIEGKVDINALKEAFNTVVQRHEVLRTNFKIVNSEPVQYVLDDMELFYEMIDLSGVREDERVEKVNKIVKSESEKCFNLGTDKLFRVHLIKLDTDNFILMLNKHHIISDKWSWDILTEEFSILYDACCKGRSVELEPLSIQYTDYVYWIEDYMVSSDFKKDEEYWIKELRGNLPVLNLPNDYLRPPIMSYKGKKEVVRIDDDVYNQIKSICKKHEVTLFMALLTATSVFLSKLSGDQDIIIGTPEAGRNQLELENIMGLFINTLALRIDLSDNPTFTEMLSRVKSKTINAFEHKDYPFDFLVEKVNPVRDMSRNPIFSTSFQVFNKTESVDIEISGLNFSRIEIQNTTSKFDQSISFTETQEGLECNFEYNSDLYSENTVCRWLENLNTMLKNICKDIDQRLDDIEMLTNSQKDKLLIEWNDTKVDYQGECLIHQLIEEQVQKSPDDIAVVFNNEEVTYGQLNCRANQFARHLIDKGLSKGKFVGICMERSIDMVVAIIGTLKAGGVYVPMNPNYPKERLNYMLRDTDLKILVVDDTNFTWLSKFDGKLISMKNNKEEILKNSNNNLVNKISSDNLAYVIYTSGSTGLPKGVQISHSNLINFLISMKRKPGISKSDVMFAVTSISFDIAGLEIFLPLIAGAKLVVADSIVSADGYMLSESLKQTKATIMQATPVTWRMLLEAGWRNEQKIKILCGGEKLPVDLARDLLTDGVEIWNLYGPTETTVWSTIYRVDKIKESNISIGRPINNTQIFILDKKMIPVPIGVVGELYIGGDGVSKKGYLNKTELTKERFIVNPYNNETVYRTGDLARYLPDGNIEFLGRIDNQVKIRGFRIELGEIENVLIEHPKLKEVVVIDRENSYGVKDLVAYVVTKDGQAISSVEMYNYLKVKLPEYMVPSWFVVLKELPLTANRKINYLELPSPSEGMCNDTNIIAPRDKTELEMLSIWQNVLKTKNINIYDNFFTIGGNSMVAMIIMDRINKCFDTKLALSQLFYSQTIAELATTIRENTDVLNECVIPLQKGNETDSPVFLIHPHGGGVYCYYDFVKALETDKTVYGIQAVGLNSDESPITSISLMADKYLKEIRRIAPTGPYNLAGWSFGGIVAYEVARRLESIGEEVGFLGIFDAQLPRKTNKDKEVLKGKLPLYIEYAMLLDIDEKQLQGLKEDEILQFVLNHGKKVRYFPEDTTIEAVRNIMKVMLNNSHALKQYRYVGKIKSDINLYYVTEESIKPKHSLINPKLWHENTTGNVTMTPVEGNHHTMLQLPNVITLAEKVKNNSLEL